LLAGEIDIAVHSLKDLPTELAAGLTIAATPERADVRDVLVTRDGRTLDALSARARIGTGAGRRAVQLQELRRDIEPAEIRGNVDTRIRKVDAGEYDGAILAMAGLARLGLSARAAQVFSIDEMLPAVGQGAMAIEVRADDAETREFVGRIDAHETRAAVDAERAFLRRLGGGCRLPVGAYAVIEDGVLRVRGMIASGDARVERPAQIFSGETRGPIADAQAVGARLADQLLAQGAQKFVDAG
jgi:hydroxymethylbilane synthase